MTKKKKQTVSEAIKRFREGPRLEPPKPQPPKPPEYFDSPGLQSPEQRKKSKYRNDLA